jgi:Protein of unknown function (DUF3592)
VTTPAFEPELLQPTPRRLSALDGCAAGCVLWPIRLFILPHTLVGPFLIYQAVKATVLYFGVLWAGVEVEGHVTGKAEHPSRKGSYYTADYAFAVDGIEYAGQFQPDAGRYALLQEGQPIPVRAWPAAPRDGHWTGSSGATLGAAGTAWVMALFWNGILSVFLWQLYVRPYRQRRLVRYGVPTAGIVRAVTAQESRQPPETYQVRYEYAVPAGHRTAGGLFHGTATAHRNQGDAELRPGDVLTVLYDPRRPRRSVLYRFGDYKAVEPVSR